MTARLSRCLLLAFLDCALFATHLAAQGRVAGLRGVVTGVQGQPLEGVELTVVGAAPTAISDMQGRFALDGIEPGWRILTIRRIGFRAQRLGAELKDGEVKEVSIVLEAGVFELPELTVSARSLKPVEYAWTTRYDDFFRRRRTGFGVFLTRADIERRHPFHTPNLLAGVSGVKLRFRHAGLSGTDVAFLGCERVSVWIDGQKQRYPDIPSDDLGRKPNPGSTMMRSRRMDTTAMATGSYLQRVLPIQIELLEVFRGPSEMPAEFLDDSCAAVAIWTR